MTNSVEKSYCSFIGLFICNIFNIYFYLFILVGQAVEGLLGRGTRRLLHPHRQARPTGAIYIYIMHVSCLPLQGHLQMHIYIYILFIFICKRLGIS